MLVLDHIIKGCICEVAHTFKELILANADGLHDLQPRAGRPPSLVRIGALSHTTPTMAERLFHKIKPCWCVAPRHDKLAANYLAFIKLASIRNWLRADEGHALLLTSRQPPHCRCLISFPARNRTAAAPAY
jgi:hypothetical protein